MAAEIPGRAAGPPYTVSWVPTAYGGYGQVNHEGAGRAAGAKQ